MTTRKQAYVKKLHCADCNLLTDSEMMCEILLGAHNHKLVCEKCMWSYYEHKDQ